MKLSILLYALCALVLCALPGRILAFEPAEGDRDPLYIESLAAESMPEKSAAKIATWLDDLRGHPFEPEIIAELFHKLESLEGIGSLELEQLREEMQDDRRVASFMIRNEPEVLRVAQIWVRMKEDPNETPDSVALIKRIEGRQRPFFDQLGQRFHPTFTTFDRAIIRSFYKNRGYRDVDVQVDFKKEAQSGLIDITYIVDRGPLYRISQVDILGTTLSDFDLQVLKRQLNIKPGDEAPLSEESLAKDTRTIRRAQCALGYPRAKVTLRETVLQNAGPEGLRDVQIRFLVEIGFKAKTGRIQVAGLHVPYEILQALPLQEGEPFCGNQVDESKERIAAYLRDNGYPDPQIQVFERRRMDKGKTRLVSISFDIQNREDVRIAKIWFSGHKVTDERILRQMLAIQEGDKYKQSAVDLSLQAMLRSGLFKRAKVELVPGPSPGVIFVHFKLEETNPFGFDVVKQKLTLRNLAVERWPSSFDDLEVGRAFRGSGQSITSYIQPNHQSLLWENPYLGRYAIARFDLDRYLDSNDLYSEQWYHTEMGVGLKLLQGAIILLPLFELDWTSSSAKVDTPLPLTLGNTLTLGAGGELVIDLVRRDDERIPYLGIELSGSGSSAWAVTGDDLLYVQAEGEASTKLPLWTKRNGQHVVLGLSGQIQMAWSRDDRPLLPHQRISPKLRGYASKAFGFDIVSGDITERLGGQQAMTLLSELRIPLPFGRRNAIVPFGGVATVADQFMDLYKEIDGAAGMMLTLSLFNEAVEGFVWGAYPIASDAKPEYVGFGLGGNF